MQTNSIFTDRELLDSRASEEIDQLDWSVPFRAGEDLLRLCWKYNVGVRESRNGELEVLPTPNAPLSLIREARKRSAYLLQTLHQRERVY
jgi:hypothetical protein